MFQMMRIQFRYDTNDTDIGEYFLSVENVDLIAHTLGVFRRVKRRSSSRIQLYIRFHWLNMLFKLTSCLIWPIRFDVTLIGQIKQLVNFKKSFTLTIVYVTWSGTGLRRMLLRFDQGQNLRRIGIHNMYNFVGDQEATGVTLFHDFTFCGVVSKFRNKGKKTV